MRPPSSVGSTSTPASGVTNSGGPPTRVATTERADAMASSVARPNGSTRLGWQTTSAAAIHAGTSPWSTRPTTRIAPVPSSAPRSGPSPTKVSVPSPRCSNARARRRTFLRSVSAAEAEKRRTVRLEPSVRACGFGVARSEALEVDAAVDHLGLAAASGTASSSWARNHEETAITVAARRTTWRVARRTPRLRADVRDVLAVRGDDERRARRECSGETCRYEEVRVDDLRIEAPRRASGISEQLEVPRVPPVRVSTTARSISCPRARSSCSRFATKMPRSGSRGPGYICETRRIRSGYPRVTWRIPRHISSVVPSPHRTYRGVVGTPDAGFARLPTSCRQVTRTTSPGCARAERVSVYAFCQWKSQRGMSSSTFAREVPGFSSSLIDEPRRCMWPAATWIVVGVEMRRSHVDTGLAAGLPAVPRQRMSRPAGVKAARRSVLAGEVEERLVPVAELPGSPFVQAARPGRGAAWSAAARAPRRPGDREHGTRAVGRICRSGGCSGPASRSGCRRAARRLFPRGAGFRPSPEPRRRSSSRCSASRRFPPRRLRGDRCRRNTTSPVPNRRRRGPWPPRPGSRGPGTGSRDARPSAGRDRCEPTSRIRRPTASGREGSSGSRPSRPSAPTGDMRPACEGSEASLASGPPAPSAQQACVRARPPCRPSSPRRRSWRAAER